jgi:hypothetical protein
MTRKISRVNPIRNYREGSPRERAYDRRNALIALAAQPVVVGAILLIFRCDLRTALLGLGAVDFGVLALVAIPVAAMLMRNDAATGLAAIGGVTTVGVDAVSLAMQRTLDCEPQRTDRDGQVLLACKTSRSNLSYGEWIVMSVTRRQDQLVTVEALSWNTSPTVTFGINRRNLRRLAGAVSLDDTHTLARQNATRVLDAWVGSGLLSHDKTPRPVWHSATRDL